MVRKGASRVACSAGRRVAFRGVWSALFLMAACAGHPAAPAPPPAPATRGVASSSQSVYLMSRELMVPVSGVAPSQVPDTYTSPRSGGREHRALDILAPRGTPVLAADYGRVLRLRTNPAGGITIYEIDAGNRYVYYYAHLDHYASALTEGKNVAKGEIIGYVGTTGNAPANVPHLHFQLMKRPNAARWWDGEPIDPKPFLTLPGRPASGS
jgi:murein DD-endopeptidase MepM/ murein hydrolase activator NlpD